MISRAIKPLRVQRAVQPRHWGAVTFHTNKQRISVAKFAVNVLIDLRRDVAGICSKHQPVILETNKVSGFREHIEVAMFSKEWHRGNRAAFEWQLIHFRHFNNIVEPTLF